MAVYAREAITDDWLLIIYKLIKLYKFLMPDLQAVREVTFSGEKVVFINF